MLVVDCCIRGADSATRRYYQAYLRRERVRDAQVIELAKLGIPACVPDIVERLDIDPARREALLEQAIARLSEGRMEEGTR